LFGLLGQPGFQAIDLDQQDGLGIAGKACVDGVFHRLDGEMIHHFQRRRDDALGNDVRYRLAGIVQGIEDSQQGLISLGLADQAQDGLGDNAQHPLRAHEQARQIVTGEVFGRPAEVDDGAVREHHLQPQDVIGRHAVFEGMRPAGIGSHVSPDGAGCLAGRVRGINQPPGLAGPAYL